MIAGLSFAEPLLLLGFILLPLIWFIVRALPPRPRQITFPPLRLLSGLEPGEPPSARTPPWLLLLRLLIASLIILALARPVLDPEKRDGSAARVGPLVIMLDNGWETASRFGPRLALVERLLARAAREGREAALLLSAPPIGGWPETVTDGNETTPFLPAAQLARTLGAVAPVPFSPDHVRLSQRLRALNMRDSEIIFISDGLVHRGSERLQPLLADARVFLDGAAEAPFALLPVVEEVDGFRLTALRPKSDTEALVRIVAEAADGRMLGEATARFAGGSERAEAGIAIPAELRRRVARIALTGEASSAGGTILLDRRSGRPRVGLAASESGAAQQPFRSGLFYLRRALEPMALVEEDTPSALPGKKPEAIILADIGALTPELAGRYRSYVREGGLLIRFAGPRLAERDDGLVPVPLRAGERAVGGALSWETPQPIAPFPSGSPFFGLEPPADITVRRQVLAAPGIALAEQSWARLADGTPIVTGRREGQGHIVLFHTTASPDWTDLPLSGLFVEMLERLLLLARAPEALGIAAGGEARLAPQSILDGHGKWIPAPAGLAPVPAEDFPRLVVSPRHPPGLYGSPSAPLALSLVSRRGPIDDEFRFIRAPWQGDLIEGGEPARRELAPGLLALLLLLLIADGVVSLMLRGLALMPRWRRITPMLLPFMLAISHGDPAHADAEPLDEDFARTALAETRFAYVLSGNAGIDRRSHAGLVGLARVLSLRTAVMLGEPMGVTPGRDPLMLFPFLYYPLPASASPPAEAALLALSEYLAGGGVLLVDTGSGDEAGTLPIEPIEAARSLERTLGRLDLPPLVPVSDEHVLARSFYLLESFPGRIAGRPLWATRASIDEEPRVSSILIGSADWAGAWAIDANDHFLVPELAGGMRQRERAFRVGINMAIYALTGTYKADQLHLPALLERLGN